MSYGLSYGLRILHTIPTHTYMSSRSRNTNQFIHMNICVTDAQIQKIRSNSNKYKQVCFK